MIIISSYCVEAKSRMELRQLAKKIRTMFGLENELYFPIADVLELLPEFDSEAHSSDAYIILDKKNGAFRQYREFTKDHLPILEIGYHFESGLSENGLNVFHIHEYTQPGIEHRQKGRYMTPDEIQKYRKYFKGVSDVQINEYLDYYRRKNNDR